MAAQYSMKYFEASAKADIGIAAFFETLMTQVYNKRFNEDTGRRTFKLGEAPSSDTQGGGQ